MAEYIEREAFEEDVRLRYCKDCHKRQHEVYCRSCWVDDMLGEIEEAPTADVVEVVRCKDCKYYEIHKPQVTLNCERDGRLIPMMPDDFCSSGVRKGEGE